MLPSSSASDVHIPPLRIGIFSESFAPVQNGVTTSILTLVHGLRARHHHVSVFAPAHQQQHSNEFNVFRFPSFVTVFNRDYPVAYPFLPRITLANHFHRLKLNIVHTHTPFVLGLTGANLALASHIPLVSTFHTLYTRYAHYVPLLPEQITTTLLEHYVPWYYSRCSVVICPSEVAAHYLRSRGVTTPIAVIPTGIPLPPESIRTAESRRRVREQYHLPLDAPLLLYAGRLAREKNLEWLLEVFQRVLIALPAALLVMAGGGPHAAELQSRVAALGLEERVRFLGPIDHREMPALFAACDVFCFPSPSETQGLVVGEARAAGTPCVVVDAGGAPETVVHGVDGFRVPPDAPDIFAARVIEIIQNPQLRLFLQQNALRNALHFTPEHMIERTVQVYRQACALERRSQDHLSALSTEKQNRFEDLLLRNTTGTLSTEEHEELSAIASEFEALRRATPVHDPAESERG
ncbi:MAG: glycosyltransferase [Chloroherpetonaceae bacterium]|nr:glycosyltransferase [Chthonomonadaceae bacterium]MDW8207521.1 glycosyltransferase [Chloroherpetonaceae bacterium]